VSEMSGRCTTRAPTSSSPSTKAPSRTTTRWSALHTRRASTSRPDSPSACRRCRRSRSTPARRRRRCPGRPRPAAQRLTAHVTLNHRPQPPWPPAGNPVHKHPHLAPQQLCRSPWHNVPGAGRGTSSRRSARPRRRTACGAGCAATSRAGPGNSARRSVASRSTTRRPSRPAPAGPRRPGPPTSTAAAACCSPPGPANRGPAAPRTRGAAAVFGGGVAAGDAAVPSLGVGRTAVLDGRRLWVAAPGG